MRNKELLQSRTSLMPSDDLYIGKTTISLFSLILSMLIADFRFSRSTPRITTKRTDRRAFLRPGRPCAARPKPTTISFCPGVSTFRFRSFSRSSLTVSNAFCPHMARRFYYPTGRPISKEQLDASLLRLAATFQQLPNCQASREHFGTIAKVIQRRR